MSDANSFENHKSAEPNQQAPAVVTLDSECDIPIENSQLISSCETSTSVWTYFSWLFWAIISGFLRCGKALFFHHFANQWIISPVEQQGHEVDGSSEFALHYDYSVPAESATVSVVGTQCACLQSSNQVNVYSDLKSLPNTSVASANPSSLLDINPSANLPELFSENFDEYLTSFSEFTSSKFDSADCWSVSNGYLSDQSIINPSVCTLLSSYYLGPTNNLIDSITIEKSVDELVRSVIPRNLSDCSGVTVCPEIRKMYAWNKLPMDYMNEKGEKKQQANDDVLSRVFDSEKQMAYPGKLNSSGAPSPPLSQSTLDSSTPIGSPSDLNTTVCAQFTCEQDREHTLVWAMSSLKMNNTDDSVSTSRSTPQNLQTRQSRDKSPVSTVNSARISDCYSSSNFASSIEHVLQEKALSFSEPAPKPKRSSSLKSNRTPPDTPEPKSVRFADALGLELETVRHVFDQEVPPKIPASATFGLELDTDESIAKLGAKQFGLCFAQPGLASNFIRRVLNQTVCLEDAQVNMPRGVLTGTVRVRSLGFEKRIFIRTTYNNWATYCDTPASYVQGSHDGTTDRFAFSVVFPDTMIPGDRAQFAIRYEAHTGEHFWDNNHGQNYSVACYAKATDLAGDGSWVHYL